MKILREVGLKKFDDIFTIKENSLCRNTKYSTPCHYESRTSENMLTTLGKQNASLLSFIPNPLGTLTGIDQAWDQCRYLPPKQ